MKILVSSFEPFAEAKTNSSLMVSKKLALDPQNKDIVFAHEIPVRYQSGWVRLKDIIDKERPDFILALGQAENSKNIALERWGLNWIESRAKDNDGVVLTNQEILTGTPPAIKTNVDLDKFYDQLCAAQIPVHISVSAGGFLCNFIYYHLLLTTSQSLFVHLPLALEQEDSQFQNMTKLELRALTQGVQLILNQLR